MSRQLIPLQRLHKLRPTRPKRTFAPPVRVRTLSLEELYKIINVGAITPNKMRAVDCPYVPLPGERIDLMASFGPRDLERTPSDG